MKYKTAVRKLTEIKNSPDTNDLTKDCIDLIIYNADGYELIDDFFNDLFQHGCISGIISGLIYYSETHKFTKKHLEEIMNFKQELETEIGEAIHPKEEFETDQLNWLAWLAFEETARKLAYKLEIEI